MSTEKGRGARIYAESRIEYGPSTVKLEGSRPFEQNT